MSPIGTFEAATVRPMHAAGEFARALRDDGLLDRTWRIKCELYRAPSPAGRDRDVDIAVLLGLEGEEADCVDSSAIARRLRRIYDKRELQLLGTRRVAFDKRHHLVLLHDGNLPSQTDGMRLSAFDPAGTLLLERTY
jgi:L-serine dehydratase